MCGRTSDCIQWNWRAWNNIKMLGWGVTQWSLDGHNVSNNLRGKLSTELPFTHFLSHYVGGFEGCSRISLSLSLSLSLRVFIVCSRYAAPQRVFLWQGTKLQACRARHNYKSQSSQYCRPAPAAFCNVSNPKHTLLPFLSRLAEIPPIFSFTTCFPLPVKTRSHHLPKSCMKDFKDELGQTHTTHINTCFDCSVRTRAPYRSLFYIILLYYLTDA